MSKPSSSETHGETFGRGLEIRREVLGDVHVTRSLERATDFTEDIQFLVTEYCWGVTWARPGLDRKTRSMITLGLLTALNRPHELGVHVRGAVNNGVEVDEIREVLLHTAIYCGVPAALESFRIAEAVLSELGSADA